MSIFTTHAKEEGTFIVNAAFADEDGNAETPSAVTWTLTDTSGNVINSREDEVITPDESVDIILSGDDLALQLDESGNVVRVLTVEALYDSDLQNNLPLKSAVKFIIDSLVAVA